MSGFTWGQDEEGNIQPEKKQGKPSQWPWRTTEVGQSFKAPDDPKERKRLKNIMHQINSRARKGDGKEMFTMEQLANGNWVVRRYQ